MAFNQGMSCSKIHTPRINIVAYNSTKLSYSNSELIRKEKIYFHIDSNNKISKPFSKGNSSKHFSLKQTFKDHFKHETSKYV